ncbi:hypothetical protein [Flavobacterium foetidum]|uniref:hypothetical protein n=1 Tax=Flavobacterium foetidum TaxID=2026681 RepID=UPI001074E09F|nr:hypothetical protein [Flavobacterium foetidum]KAF2518059.1 hypothetical protein E0W73_02265 [Flavobacterium foetidum]
MSTLDNNNRNSGRINNHLEDITNVKESDNNNREIAERGYTVRNGYNPNGINPDQEDYLSDDDLDDLDDDFHTDRDLEDNNDDIYEVELESEDEYIEEGIDDEVENDEFDNPADTFENDFNETEDDLEDIDQDEDEDYENEDNEYIEDDVQESDDEEDYPDNDPRKF